MLGVMNKYHLYQKTSYSHINIYTVICQYIDNLGRGVGHQNLHSEFIVCTILGLIYIQTKM